MTTYIKRLVNTLPLHCSANVHACAKNVFMDTVYHVSLYLWAVSMNHSESISHELWQRRTVEDQGQCRLRMGGGHVPLTSPSSVQRECSPHTSGAHLSECTFMCCVEWLDTN